MNLDASANARQRIDKWLWFARMVKTRSLAQKLAVSGRVRLNRGRNESASRPVKTGDILTIALDSGVRVLRILDLGFRRGPPSEARLLYEDLSPPRTPALDPAAPRTPGSGRPTKRQRRAVDALKRSSGEIFPAADD
ncbi:MAG: RNA-binding S4 domain-containing protein [Bauldia sp.]